MPMQDTDSIEHSQRPTRPSVSQQINHVASELRAQIENVSQFTQKVAAQPGTSWPLRTFKYYLAMCLALVAAIMVAFSHYSSHSHMTLLHKDNLRQQALWVQQINEKHSELETR